MRDNYNDFDAVNKDWQRHMKRVIIKKLIK